MILKQARAILDRHFREISIEDASYEPIDDGVCDAATITLVVPRRMLDEYSKLAGQKILEDFGFEFYQPPKKTYYSELAERFWKQSGFLEKLEGFHDKYHGQGMVFHLSDVSDYLHGKVNVEVQELNNPDYLRVDVQEVVRTIFEEESDAIMRAAEAV